MSDKTTVIIFLLDERGIPGLEDKTYLCSMLDVPQRSSFSPAKVTHDTKGLRDTIIGLVDSRIAGVDELRTKIGRRIWINLGLGHVFGHLTEHREEVTFLTNDPAIPWEWATPHNGKQSLCEVVSCGTVFFEQMELAAKAIEGGTRRRTVPSIEEQIEKMRAVLLFDGGGHHSLGKLSEAKLE